GTFSQDEDVVLIPFTNANLSLVTIQTTSFALGGFEPVLTVYDSLGNFLFQDATGGVAPGSCGGRGSCSGCGGCLDALISQTFAAGDYTIALTEWDNIPNGPTLGDGFPQTGNGNFTSTEFGCGPGSFFLFDCSQRSADWALTINGQDVVTPEPGTM